MKIENINIYNQEHAFIACRYPMEFVVDTSLIPENIEKGMERMKKLAAAPTDSGHCTALAGILVTFDVTGTVKWWAQMERYHFAQIVSSQSTMHRLETMLKNDSAFFNPKTDKRAIDLVYQLYREGKSFEEIVYSCPMGLELTAHIATNMLQLKTIYFQRKNHKLEEWRIFCDFIKSLRPYSDWFTTENNGE